MKTITLRDLPPELASKLEQLARSLGLSPTKAALRLLEESLGLRKARRPIVHHDLDALAGTWTREEARLFEKSIRAQRKIDPELWR
jgi:predicted transcriptional regulator